MVDFRRSGPLEPRGLPLDQLVVLVMVVGLALGCWAFLRPHQPAPVPVPPGDTSLLRLTSPALQPGWTYRLTEPDAATWWRQNGWEHRVTGQVLKPGQYQVRPWLQTTDWLPQPVVNVAADGTFTAVVYFSPLYDGPLTLAFELESRTTRQVLGKVNYVFEPEGRAAR